MRVKGLTKMIPRMAYNISFLHRGYLTATETELLIRYDTNSNKKSPDGFDITEINKY